MTEGAKQGVETIKEYFRKMYRTAVGGLDGRETSHSSGDWAGETAAITP